MGYKERIKEILHSIHYTSYGVHNAAVETAKNNGLLAYQTCLLEDILAELVDAREAGYGRYLDED